MNKLINIQKKTAHKILQLAQDYDLGTLLEDVTLTFNNVTFLSGDERNRRHIFILQVFDV